MLANALSDVFSTLLWFGVDGLDLENGPRQLSRLTVYCSIEPHAC